MNQPYRDRLWIVRRRVLFFFAAFCLGFAAFAGLAWLFAQAKGDPGPWVYLLVPALALMLGSLALMAWLVNGWSRRHDVENCPHCDIFLWHTRSDCLVVAFTARCPYCERPLVEPSKRDEK